MKFTIICGGKKEIPTYVHKFNHEIWIAYANIESISLETQYYSQQLTLNYSITNNISLSPLSIWPSGAHPSPWSPPLKGVGSIPNLYKID